MDQSELYLESTYIVKGKNANNMNDVMKIKIIDLTKKSIRYLNLDNDVKVRITKSDFNYKYQIIESVNDVVDLINLT